MRVHAGPLHALSELTHGPNWYSADHSDEKLFAFAAVIGARRPAC